MVGRESEKFLSLRDDSVEIGTCYPTAVLNGLITLGILSPEQASQVKEYILENPDRFFAYRALSSGVQERTFFGYKRQLIQAVNESCGITVENIHAVNIYELVSPETTVAEILSFGGVIIGGDADHAVLVLGRQGEQVIISDPVRPTQLTSIPILSFVQMTKEEGWMTVIHTIKD